MAKYVRLRKTTYPGGRVVAYNCGAAGGIDDRLRRVRAIANAAGTTTYAQYAYLGAATVVKVGHSAVSGGLTLSHGSPTDAPGGYVGFDAFGRIADHHWRTSPLPPC